MLGGMRRIVLTGGPGAGKTVLSRAIVDRHPDQLRLVSESATQVYRALNTRRDRLDIEGRREVQRRIYHLQVEQEERIGRGSPGSVLLLDRGTLDGSVYWPGYPEEYWPQLGTTRHAELARYDAVIMLQTCAVLGVYDGDKSNFCRTETSADAIASGDLLEGIWGDHPHMYRVPAFADFAEKLEAVDRVVSELLEVKRKAQGL